MEIFVLRATIDDVGQISEIWLSCGLSPWPRSDIERETDRRDSIFLAAHTGERAEILGFILGRLIPSTRNETGLEAEIYNIGVHPEIRNRGVGSVLLESFKNQCLESGAGRIWLEVRASNKTAIMFYRRHGFTDAGNRKSFYRDPVEDALVMSSSP